MKVLYSAYWGGKKHQCELNDTLTPVQGDERGQVEQAMDLAEKNAAMLGKLAALLVEKNILTLDEAFEASGKYGEVSLLPDDPLTDLGLD